MQEFPSMQIKTFVNIKSPTIQKTKEQQQLQSQNLKMGKKEKELLFINERNGDWPTWEIQRNIETDSLKKEFSYDI